MINNNNYWSSALKEYYLLYLYKNNVDLRKGINYIVEDVFNGVSYETSLKINKLQLKTLLKSYLLYGAGLYDIEANKVYNLLNSNRIGDQITIINNVEENFQYNIGDKDEFLWIGGDEDNPYYSYQDWYTVADTISVNISINKNFLGKLKNGNFKEGFLSIIGDINKETAASIDNKINSRIRDESTNFVLLPFVTDEAGTLNVDFIELTQDNEEFLNAMYVNNKSEISEGLGVLNERILNLTPSLRSGTYQSSANERLNLLLNIYNRNIHLYQELLDEQFTDLISFDWLNEDIQTNKAEEFNRLMQLQAINSIDSNQVRELYNEMFDKDLKPNKFLQAVNTSIRLIEEEEDN